MYRNLCGFPHECVGLVRIFACLLFVFVVVKSIYLLNQWLMSETQIRKDGIDIAFHS